MSFGENLKKRRLEIGCTLREVSDKLGITEAALQRYECGSIKNPKYDNIVKLAAILKTTPATLMGWEEIKNSPTKTVDEQLYELFSSLSEEKQKQALDFLRFLKGE